jgi:hypothetical protein
VTFDSLFQLYIASGVIDRVFLLLARLLEKLKRYGAAGVLSYGLLNTVYYVTAFLLVW